MLDRSLAPEIHEFENFTLPQTEVKTLGNGAKVHYLANSTQPVLRFEIVFPAGKWFEKGKGASYFTSKLLLEGTRNKTSKQIADILDFYGASLECNQGFDYATLTLYCLSRHFTTLLPLVTEILNEPAFPEKEFELLKQRTAQNIAVERKKPAYLAMERFTRNVYGQNHPYTTGLDNETIEKIQLSDIRDFYSSQFTIGAAEIFTCGDLNQELKDAIENLQLHENTNTAVVSTPKHEIQASSLKENITIPDSLQAAIRYGKTFPLINHPDYIKLTILTKTLGGYFGSRLMKNIREDKGFTYGIYASLSPRKYSTLFFIGTEVNAAKAGETVVEIDKELELLKNTLISEAELQTVKNYIIGKFLSESNTVFDQMDRYKHLILYNLPLDYFTSYFATIRSTTAQDLQELSNQYFAKPLNLVTAGA
ncbi:M16 family metallopeptidase [Adhaeribacter terreus]|uniref:M16 family metallopeptidase n=1 Tax=Adhaeribacter terreus TaxID=529703 RepID=A0ABW0E517_9BACT